MPTLVNRGRGRRTINEINMVPFIDVMLVLLIIFMVTAPLITPSVIKLPTVGKAAKQPDFGRAAASRQCILKAGKRMIGRHGPVEIGDGFRQIIREVVDRHAPGAVALKRVGRALVTARRAPHAQIDTPRRQRREQGEGFRHLEWRIMRQHDSARADTDA